MTNQCPYLCYCFRDRCILERFHNDKNCICSTCHHIKRRKILDELVKESERLGFYKDDFIKNFNPN